MILPARQLHPTSRDRDRHLDDIPRARDRDGVLRRLLSARDGSRDAFTELPPLIPDRLSPLPADTSSTPPDIGSLCPVYSLSTPSEHPSGAVADTQSLPCKGFQLLQRLKAL